MKWTPLLLCFCVLVYSSVLSQTLADSAKVNTLISQSKSSIAENPDKAAALALQANELAQKIGFDKGAAQALKTLGIVYYYQHNEIETLNYWSQSLKLFEKLKDDVGIANILNNMGALYFDQALDEKALELYLRSLKLSEQSGDKLRIATALNNIGGVYFNKKATHDKALDFFGRALPIAEQSGDIEAIRTSAANLGEVYAALNKDSLALLYYNKALKEGGVTESSPYINNLIGKFYAKKGNDSLALYYHQKAYTSGKKFESQLDIVQSLIGQGAIYEKKKQYAAALALFKEAETIADKIKAQKELELIYDGLAKTYHAQGNNDAAYEYRTKYAETNATLYNAETDKRLVLRQYDFDLQKKQDRIDLLTKENSLREAELRRQKLVRIGLILGAGLLLLIALIIFRNYREKVKTNKILDSQKAKIESLLLNILPLQVALELQTTGHATPKSYDRVAVMFTDFKDFTNIADKLSPEELVKELNVCFVAFDKIIEKYDLEKIKTIGDAYMCAGGIPAPDAEHAYKIVKAGLEIQEYIGKMNKERAGQGKPIWMLRLGIHAGPLVAGVVGKKKYAYDIWGSTVNIASRMESNGQPGKVNISAGIYELVKDRFICSYRGKIHAKNVGEVDMYFVEQEIDLSNRLIQASAAAAENIQPEKSITE